MTENMQVRSARNHWRIEMFDTIAPTYDILNHLLSAGIDKSWRKKGIQAIRAKRPKKILDIATGTGDLAILANKILQPEEIIGIDISEKMLQIAIQKAQAEGAANIQFLHGDCMNLHFPENAFDAVTVAFGVRNFEKLEQGLQEILRVLKPDGQLMILELTIPEKFLLKQLYTFYSKWIIPTAGWLIAGNRRAYSYLPASVSTFIQGKEMQAIMQKNRYVNVHFQQITGGICTLYIGEKNSDKKY